jgi:CMP-N,N'-diacetyllegionaminic acid synthase
LVVARGGSKSIPRKNIAPLAGKPLLAWTIDAALRSKGAGRVVVSTEDEEIATVARQHGAETPFTRPESLAEDDTPTIPVVLHALNWLEENENFRPDLVVLLQPTSPLRTTEDITAAIDLSMRARGGGSVVSVTPAAAHPYLMKRITAEGLLEDVAPHPVVERRQDLDTVYALNGAIYIARREHLVEYASFYAERTYAYVMPPERSIDVDTPWDLHLCELILRERNARD